MASLLLCLIVSTAFGPLAAALKAEAIESLDFNVTAALETRSIFTNEVPGLKDLKEGSAPKCQSACHALHFLYGNDAVLVEQRGGEGGGKTPYDEFLDGFWSGLQGDVTPTCIFEPQTADDLSVLILVSRFTQCPFAVRSGGHAAFTGASNVEDGITVSLAKFTDVSLSEDRKIAAVGAGNIWGPVYEYLEPYNLTVIGGRLYNVGVGGLTLGGGVSYFSNKHGWACDNVESYDLVLANGALARVSHASHPDLYWALRGGGNNFGIVYQFNLRTVPLPGGNMWAGSRTYTEDQFPDVFSAFTNMIDNTADDLEANFYLVWVITPDGIKLAIPAVWHEDVSIGGDAPSFAEWNAIPAIDDTTRIRNVVEWGKETLESVSYGQRQVFYMITVKSDLVVHQFAVEKFFELAGVAVAEIEGFQGNIVPQGINVPQMEQMQKNGGNALGLDPEEGARYIIQIAIQWSDEKDDDAVYRLASDVLSSTKDESIRRGAESDYVYMNYASMFQDVISSYGQANKARLLEVSKKYDPQQVFQKLQPGYFKLKRAPFPGTDYFSH